MEQNGTKLFYLHDEGGFYFRGEYDDAVKKIYPNELFNSKSFDKIFFWGERQKSVFEDHAEKSKFVVTGSPRFDLLKPCFRHIDIENVEKLRKRYGSFVLVCTRFGAVNRVPDEPTTLSKRSYDIRAEGGALKKYSQAQVLETMFGAWEKISYEFTSFVPSLAKLVQDFPDVNFVIRPHPAERQSFYTESFSHFENVIVEKSGDVRPYIRAAEVVIHSECTTGIEAEIAGKPTINFRPCMNMPKYEGFSVEGVCDVGSLCNSYESLKISLERALSRQLDRESALSNAGPYLDNCNEFEFSFNKVVNAIESARSSNSVASYFPVFKVRSFLQLKRLLKNRFRAIRDSFSQ